MNDFNFYQNYRQRYTVIPITTVRGPFLNSQLKHVVGAQKNHLDETVLLSTQNIKIVDGT